MELEIKRIVNTSEDINSARKSMADLCIYKEIIEEGILKISSKMIEFGYSESEVEKYKKTIKEAYYANKNGP